ncbi:MAG: hypothetical protein GTO54_02690, partial [Nitrososphaeria archaeon]|nr:hypothetical protein [Nitrososphaeria archaeon]
MVIKHLRDRRTISEESQVIDINYVYRAAVHACAYLILLPISTSDELRQLRDDAFQAF